MPDAPATEIAAAAIPRCALCGTQGELAYRDLADVLFGAPGRWGFRRCPVDGLWWLDPRPLADELHKAYATYYTHAATSLRESAIGRAWFALAPLLARLGLAGMRDVLAAERMWLDERARGRLLDVGAGEGRLVARMRAAGWEAEGLEPDAEAIARARERYGVALRQGTLEALADGERFDAVTLNNVIEHVADPIATLRRAWSALAPGGRLLVLTPNVESAGHARFGARWRGLEPPRHLFLFSPRTLELVAERAGVAEARVRTTDRAAPFTYRESAGGGVRGMLAALGAVPRLLRARPGGEELLLEARRP